MPGVLIDTTTQLKVKQGLLVYIRRLKTVRAAVVTEVSEDGMAVIVDCFNWPTVTTYGNFIQGQRNLSIKRSDIYCMLKVWATEKKGTVFERMRDQRNFPELKAALRKRGGAGKSMKGSKVTERGESSKSKRPRSK